MSPAARRTLRQRAGLVRLVIMDVDGVMTDGTIVLDERGRELKSFSARDGVGIKMMHGAGLRTAIITQRLCGATRARARELGIGDVLGAKSGKLASYRRLVKKHALKSSQVAYIGDDLPDIPVIDRVGLAICPVDAAAEVKKRCHMVTAARGGRGVVREVADRLLRLRGVGRAAMQAWLVVVVAAAILAAGPAQADGPGEVIQGFYKKVVEKAMLAREVWGDSATWMDEQTVVVEGLRLREYFAGTVWDLEAARGELDSKKWNAVCSGNVRMESSSGERIESDELEWHRSARKLVARGSVHAVLKRARVSRDEGDEEPVTGEDEGSRD